MKKTIVILGSTGSIGETLIKLILKDKYNFNVKLLAAEKNYNKLFKQAKLLNVKNIIITNKDAYQKLINKKEKHNINIYNNFEMINKILKNKVDYCMCSISGISGLVPTFEMIKHSNEFQELSGCVLVLNSKGAQLSL